MTNLRKAALLSQIIIVCCVVVLSTRAHAQWWSSSAAPRDFEECAERAKNPATAQDNFSECEAKFAGRRKTGGGYTYFDFMQNRSFDIAGPNPSPEESKKIDEHYTAYLAEQRRLTIATAFQRNQHAAELAPPETAKVLPKQAPEPKAKITALRKPKVDTCDGRVSCGLQELSAKIQSIRKNLFGS